MTSELLAWLENLEMSSQFVSESRSHLNYFKFGSRTVEIRNLDPEAKQLLDVNLVKSLTGQESTATINILKREHLSSIPEIDAGILGPYGKLLNQELDPWLITFDSLPLKFLALNTLSLEAFYFPGDNPAPRELAEFCRPLLHWLAIMNGNVIVHAASASINGRALLIGGAGNAGKTTLTRALVGSEFAFHGDNVIEVSFNSGSPEVYGIYPSYKVRPSSNQSITGYLPEGIWDWEAQKDIYLFGDSLQSPFLTGPVLLTAVLNLSEDGGQEIEVQPKGEAFYSMSPNTVAQFPYFEKQVLQRVGTLVERVPCFKSGRLNLDSAPTKVSELLKND